MKTDRNFTEKQFEFLIEFIDNNPEVNLKMFNFQNQEALDSLNWKKKVKNRDELLAIVKAYQRILRILPESDQNIAIALLKLNVHSAIQIASMTKKSFMEIWEKVSSNQELGEMIYKNAIHKKTDILIQYMNNLQNNEPHIKATLFNR